MVLILDGNSEICTHVRNNLCYLICLKQLLRSRAVTMNMLALLNMDGVEKYYLISKK